MVRCSVIGLVLIGLLSAGIARAVEPDVNQPLTLSACIALAMTRNAQVKSAERQLERTEADVLGAWSSVLPNVNTTVFGFGRFTTGPSVRVQETPIGLDPITQRPIYEQKEVVFEGSSRNSYSLSFSVNQTVYDGGRSQLSIRQARSGKQAAEYNLTARKEAIALAVQRQYYELLKAQKLLLVQEEAVARSRRQLEKAESLLAIGSGIEADVLRSKVALGNDQIALINAQNALLRARAEMNNTLGLDIDTPAAFVDSVAPPGRFPELQQAIAEAQTHNPEIHRLEQELRATEAGVGIARGAYLPRVGLSISYGRNGEEVNRVYQQLDKNYQVNISTGLTYNLFDGFSKRANLNRATATMLAAREGLEQAKQDVALAVKRAFLELDRSKQVVEITGEHIASAAEDLRLAEERYRVGTGTILEVTDAHVNLTRAQVNNVQSRYDLKIAEAELEYAMGGRGE
ncbi:MAG: TolC family protein [Candidatus Latescibacteria bacterium]|nr:TolC family protein [Candidatus Latescibacterota bacterium]